MKAYFSFKWDTHLYHFAQTKQKNIIFNIFDPGKNNFYINFILQVFPKAHKSQLNRFHNCFNCDISIHSCYPDVLKEPSYLKTFPSATELYLALG